MYKNVVAILLFFMTVLCLRECWLLHPCIAWKISPALRPCQHAKLHCTNAWLHSEISVETQMGAYAFHAADEVHINPPEVYLK